MLATPAGAGDSAIGVIGIAIGTVLLPEMSRRLTAATTLAPRPRSGGRSNSRCCFRCRSSPRSYGARCHHARDVRARRVLKADAAAAGATLAAYAFGLVPFVLIRSAVATFYARKDTATPVKAALTGVAVNVALKVALVGSLAQIGLALATAVGAWINLLLVMFFAVRAGYLELDRAWVTLAGKICRGRRHARRRAVVHRAIRRRPFRADACIPRRGHLALLMAAGAFVYGFRSCCCLAGAGFLSCCGAGNPALSDCRHEKNIAWGAMCRTGPICNKPPKSAVSARSAHDQVAALS